MIDDLISRKAVIEAVDRHTREDGTLDDDISVILEEVKTAFDKEKVIEEIKLITAGYVLNCNYTSEYVQGFIDMSKKIIETIEKGGVNEGRFN